MKFMLQWTISIEKRKPAAEIFLAGGAPLPDGLQVIGRWHAPGSTRGWLVVESDDLEALALHAAQWGDYLDIEVTPILEDEAAGKALAQVYGS